MATELILIRHGYTVRVNGDYVHAPLTPLGRQQAAQTGQYLSAHQEPIQGFYSSPLRRAHETADIIGSAINEQPAIKRGVREVEGLEVPALVLYEIASVFDPVEDYLDDRAGKSLRWPVEGRVSQALLEILAAHPNERVVVVAHAGVVSSTLAWYFPEQRGEWWLTLVRNCSLTRLAVENGRARILGVNETGHLHPEADTTQTPDRAVQVTRTVVPAIKAATGQHRRS